MFQSIHSTSNEILRPIMYLIFWTHYIVSSTFFISHHCSFTSTFLLLLIFFCFWNYNEIHCITYYNKTSYLSLPNQFQMLSFSAMLLNISSTLYAISMEVTKNCNSKMFAWRCQIMEGKTLRMEFAVSQSKTVNSVTLIQMMMETGHSSHYVQQFSVKSANWIDT